MTASQFTVLLFSVLTATAFAAPEKPPSQKHVQPAGATKTKPSSCEAEWKKFNASAACFARYRNANGSVKAEAYKHCTEVKQPLALCE